MMIQTADIGKASSAFAETSSGASSKVTLLQDANVWRPIPKPRKSVVNKTMNGASRQASNSTVFVAPKLDTNESASHKMVPPPKPQRVQPLCAQVQNLQTEAAQKLPPPLNAPPPRPVDLFNVPPPLPPRNAVAQLPSPINEYTSEVLRKASLKMDSFIKLNSPDLAESSTTLTNGVNTLVDCLNSLSTPSSACSVSLSPSSNFSSGADPDDLIFGKSNSYLDSTNHSSLKRSISSNGGSNDRNNNSASTSDQKFIAESVCFSGWVRLSQLPSNYSLKKDSEKRCWGIIRLNQLSFMRDDETTTPFLGPFDLYRCIYVGRGVENGDEITIILREVTLSLTTNNGNGKNAPWSCIKFVPENSVEYWLVFLAKCHCPQVPILQQSLHNVDIGGKLWIREGVSGAWVEGWATVYNRIISYWTNNCETIFERDIRKIILLKRDLLSTDFCNFIENSTAGPILIALEGSSLYLQAECDLCTEYWFQFLTAELHNNGQVLEENRLTADNVPVIIDKCIRHIATYGLYQPGIYRRNGSASLVRDLLRDFREDPFNVHMELVGDESINAVADILRSFLRHLKNPLIPERFHENLFQIAESPAPNDERVQAYHAIIFDLPKVYFSTIKRLLAHLQQVTSHSDKNLATIDNISKVFGPTIFTVDNPNEPVSVDIYATAARQILVMRDLLKFFDEIFCISAEEMSAKSKLDEIQEQKQNPKARAEGFLVPIHLFEKDNKCFNVQCDWSASQVISFKTEKLLVSSEALLCDAYALFEVVRGGQLERRISNDEILKQIVLGRWLEWENAASDCYLLLKKDENPFEPHNVRPFADNIKIAEPGSKTFRTAQLKVENGIKVVQYNKAMKIQNTWIVDETLWFLGCENERKPPHSFAMTFFLTNTKNGSGRATIKGKSTKFAGYCVAFPDEAQRAQWLNSVIVCKQEYLPMPLIQL